MNIVIDTSAIIAVIANEPEKQKLIDLTRGAHLFAPESIKWEVGNAFSLMLKRKRVTLEQAMRALNIFESISLMWIEIDLNQALKIAYKLGIYAYDAYVICGALSNAYPLLSLDKGLLRNAQKLNVKIVEVK
ncbi:MAG: type II toxin-antitoxin system VapC family toxin [Bacteroidota bacterium]|nr:type II toxin-antitoxin system VapC family toxin [Bacteroidota bacterium]